MRNERKFEIDTET